MELHGIDVSIYQPNILWGTVAKSQAFAILKIGGSECGRFEDRTFRYKRYIERQDEQLKVKDTQINQLATEIEESRKEREQLTKERQTLLLELLSLRGQSKITTAASAAGTGAAQEPRPQKPRQQSQQPPKKRTLRERVRDFFR